MNRHEGLDALRAGLLLYIIAFWHGFEYAPAVTWHMNMFTGELTLVALGSFLMLAGYFVGIGWAKMDGRPLTTLQKAQTLVFERLKRLYPLYFIALVLFWACGLEDAAGTIKALLLVSAVLKPAPPTLWFVLTLLTLTVLSPLLLTAADDGRRYLRRLAVMFAAAAAYALVTRLLDSRVVLYMPGFALGLWWGRHGVETVPLRLRAVAGAGLLVGAGLLGLGFGAGSQMLGAARDALLLLSGSVLLVDLALRHPRLGAVYPAVEYFAYAGYAAYLFHRPIYIALTRLVRPDGQALQVLYVLGVCVPVVFVCATAIQRLFDATLRRAKPLAGVRP